jgi:hypothetical protein
MPRTPTKAAIVAEERGLLQRQRVFRFVADRVTAVLARCRSVEAISLFGSVARPLRREVPRFAPYKQLRLPIAHECSATIWMMRYPDARTGCRGLPHFSHRKIFEARHKSARGN